MNESEYLSFLALEVMDVIKKYDLTRDDIEDIISYIYSPMFRDKVN